MCYEIFALVKPPYVQRCRQAEFNDVANRAVSRLLDPMILLANVASAPPVYVLLFVWI